MVTGFLQATDIILRALVHGRVYSPRIPPEIFLEIFLIFQKQIGIDEHNAYEYFYKDFVILEFNLTVPLVVGMVKKEEMYMGARLLAVGSALYRLSSRFKVIKLK